MKSIIFTYCEGSDTKIAVVQKEKDKIKVLQTTAFDVVAPEFNVQDDMEGLKLDVDDLGIEGRAKEESRTRSAGLSNLSVINNSLKSFNLNRSLFIPVITEPAVHYHVFEGNKKDSTANFTQEVIDDIQKSKDVTLDKENLSYVELSDKSWMAVFISGEVPCIGQINSLAQYNGKRNYQIQSVKSAEVSLAYYIAKKKKFFPDDHSLIVYIGKEYSKLIFMHGRKVKHIGTTLDIGTINLHTYDVYFSKILLEMENGGITTLDNIIVCGEDDSENIILSFYGTFPEANVSRIDFKEIDLTSLDKKTLETVSSFSVPIAAAVDYFDELEEIHKGINLLPRYVKEDQKFLQFAWHGYLMLPILFIATFFITQQILVNKREINTLKGQIASRQLLLTQNKSILNKISEVEGRINDFGKTQAILDSVSVGTGVWSNSFKKISDFFASNKSIWLTKLSLGADNRVNLEGYALSKYVLTKFAYAMKNAELRGMYYETLREKNAYKFTMNFDLSSYQKISK